MRIPQKKIIFDQVTKQNPTFESVKIQSVVEDNHDHAILVYLHIYKFLKGD